MSLFPSIRSIGSLNLITCCFTAAAVLAFPQSVRAEFTLDFSQVDYYQDLALSVDDSEWGQFRTSFTPGADILWINVVANPGTSNDWVVQNVPLLSVDMVGSGQFYASGYFDLASLGVTRGDDISGQRFELRYSVTLAPAMAARKTARRRASPSAARKTSSTAGYPLETRT